MRREDKEKIKVSYILGGRTISKKPTIEEERAKRLLEKERSEALRKKIEEKLVIKKQIEYQMTIREDINRRKNNHVHSNPAMIERHKIIEDAQKQIVKLELVIKLNKASMKIEAKELIEEYDKIEKFDKKILKSLYTKIRNI